jgi:mRNA export factor
MAGLFGSSSSSTQANNTLGDLSKDVTVKSPPEDSISDLAFSSQSDHMAVASWDNKVRIYEVGANGEAEGKASMDAEGPVLSCHWSKVSPHAVNTFARYTNLRNRMVRGSLEQEQIKLRES